MEATGIRIAEQGGPYHPLGEGDAIASDDVRLKQLGYKQELSRGHWVGCQEGLFFFFFLFLCISFCPMRSNGLC